VTVALAAIAVALSLAALVFAVLARNEATATRGELSRHRHSHTLQRPEEPAARHSERPGPPPPADPDAAPPTAEMGAVLQPPRTRRVRDNPQA
jgi:hypothetical protein